MNTDSVLFCSAQYPSTKHSTWEVLNKHGVNELNTMCNDMEGCPSIIIRNEKHTAERYSVKPHYPQILYLQIAYSLKFICNPIINTCRTLTTIHWYAQSSKKI